MITDCASVLDGHRRGHKWATALGRLYARVWAVVYAATDGSEESVPMLWMPAHTSEAHVGVAVKSDGTALSAHDREMNGLADKFAKAAARTRRLSQQLLGKLRDEAQEVRAMALWLAIVDQSVSTSPPTSESSSPPFKARENDGRYLGFRF